MAEALNVCVTHPVLGELCLEKSSQLSLKRSCCGELSGHLAGAAEDKYFPEIYVPENPTGRRSLKAYRGQGADSISSSVLIFSSWIQSNSTKEIRVESLEFLSFQV